MEHSPQCLPQCGSVSELQKAVKFTGNDLAIAVDPLRAGVRKCAPARKRPHSIHVSSMPKDARQMPRQPEVLSVIAPRGLPPDQALQCPNQL
jgi:hypothetical protein